MQKKHLYTSIITLITFIGLAQDWELKLNSNVEIRTWKLTSTYEKEERSLSGASIVLTKGGQVVSQTKSDANGDFSVMIPPNGEFLISVSYPGCNTKIISLNTFNVPAENNKENFKPVFITEGFVMAKPFPGIDYSSLKEPLIRVEYVAKKKLFTHDDLQTEKGLAIVTKISEDETTLIKSFCGTNKEGDVALAKPDCPLAKTLYQKAMTIIPGEQYPIQQLAKVEQCLKDKEAAAKKAAEDAANKTLAEKAAAEKAAADAAAKAKADAEAKLMAEKKAKEEAEANKALKEKMAIEQANAEKAAKQKAENDRIAKEKEAADKLAAEKAAKEKAAAEKASKQKEGLAKAKAEEEAEAKAIEEKRKAKEAKEKEGMAKAKAEEEAEVKAIAEKKALKEKEAKEKALREKEGLAKAKAEDEAEAKAIEDKKRAEREAKEAEAKRKQAEAKAANPDMNEDKGDSKYSIPQVLGGAEKYKENIKKGDEYFKMKRWSEAKTAYEDALKYKAGDAYAKSKLDQVNKNLSTPK